MLNHKIDDLFTKIELIKKNIILDININNNLIKKIDCVYDDIIVFKELNSDDWEILNDISNDIKDIVKNIIKDNYLNKNLDDLKKNNLYSMIDEGKSIIDQYYFDKEDDCNCFMEIHSGNGGTDAQDWVEILSNTYIKWSSKNNIKNKIVYKSEGLVAGLKSIIIKFYNDLGSKYIYGKLKQENGIHKLIRISPFNHNKKRQTSFASINVYKEEMNVQEYIIKPQDLRIDKCRSSGAGGQHVNTTDSAVKITHIPTGIIAQSQQERSQHKNKSFALKILNERVLQYYNSLDNINIKDKKSIDGGNQIRTYTLHPYQMIKDNIRGTKTSNIQHYFNGNIDKFLLYLK